MRRHSTPTATTPTSRRSTIMLGVNTSPVLPEAMCGSRLLTCRRRPEQSCGKSTNLSWRSRQDFSARIKKDDFAIFSLAGGEAQKLIPMSRFFSIGEVARYLGVSTRTVQRWIASGELIAHRFGRTVRIAESEIILDRHPGAHELVRQLMAHRSPRFSKSVQPARRRHHPGAELSVDAAHSKGLERRDRAGK